MTKEEKIKLFEEFLDTHKAKESFFANMIFHLNKPIARYYEEMLSGISDGSSLIDRAFGWADSDEGHQYWSDLHMKWKRTLIRGRLSDSKTSTH